MSCMNLWIWSMVAIGSNEPLGEGCWLVAQKKTWMDGRMEGFGIGFLKDRSSRSKRSKPADGRFFLRFFLQFFCWSAPIIECYFCFFFWAALLQRGCCGSGTQEYVNHKHHGKDSGSDLERCWGASAGCRVSWRTRLMTHFPSKQESFYGFGNPSLPKNITWRIQASWILTEFSHRHWGLWNHNMNSPSLGSISAAACDFLMRVWRTFLNHEFPGWKPFLWKEASLRLFFHHWNHSPKILGRMFLKTI